MITSNMDIVIPENYRAIMFHSVYLQGVNPSLKIPNFYGLLLEHQKYEKKITTKFNKNLNITKYNQHFRRKEKSNNKAQKLNENSQYIIINELNIDQGASTTTSNIQVNNKLILKAGSSISSYFIGFQSDATVEVYYSKNGMQPVLITTDESITKIPNSINFIKDDSSTNGDYPKFIRIMKIDPNDFESIKFDDNNNNYVAEFSAGYYSVVRQQTEYLTIIVYSLVAFASLIVLIAIIVFVVKFVVKRKSAHLRDSNLLDQADEKNTDYL
ncbi:hypothetical protein TRFO_39612 [Tritrichomonas foetus]|uniref:Uncharacterized protein n=1 Tax=Tritrichomonas foetus TaxID=1144522 RepID=A0A1J4J473_9EUKA|nr:hypothetical protein TRFO_39612 [Tritrichomonas foetus]|eukprot:OHS94162.1 hypothetical protein TRFO_39612 [Tritrichomonas foetus]